MPHLITQAALPSLLQLEAVQTDVFRSVHHERNGNDRIYGGQIIAQMFAAARQTVAPEREPTLLQLAFLQGARADVPVDYRIERLQDGQRFSTRHVRGVQGDRIVADGQVSFQQPAKGPVHQRPLESDIPLPASVPSAADLHESLRTRFKRSGYAAIDPHPFIDLRLIDVEDTLDPARAGQTIRFWLRINHPLPDDPAVHATALAYLSDWWINYPGVAPHIPQTGEQPLYVVSLNHTMWFHRPCRVDDWLLCRGHSPQAGSQRALSVVDVQDRSGAPVATITQQCLLAPRAAARSP